MARKCQHYDTNFEYHSYCPPCVRSFTVTLLNAHHRYHRYLGRSVHCTTNITKNKMPLSHFSRRYEQHWDLRISNLLRTAISIEKPYKVDQGPSQCQHLRCQTYGQTMNSCAYTPRCVKCGEDHSSVECTNNRPLPDECALCSCPTRVLLKSKGCSVFKQIDSATHKLIITVKRIPPIPLTQVFSAPPHSRKRNYADITANQSSATHHQAIKLLQHFSMN